MRLTIIDTDKYFNYISRLTMRLRFYVKSAEILFSATLSWFVSDTPRFLDWKIWIRTEIHAVAQRGTGVSARSDLTICFPDIIPGEKPGFLDGHYLEAVLYPQSHHARLEFKVCIFKAWFGIKITITNIR